MKLALAVLKANESRDFNKTYNILHANFWQGLDDMGEVLDELELALKQLKKMQRNHIAALLELVIEYLDEEAGQAVSEWKLYFAFTVIFRWTDSVSNAKRLAKNFASYGDVDPEVEDDDDTEDTLLGAINTLLDRAGSLLLLR